MIAGKNPCSQIQRVQNLVELGICDGRNMYPVNNVYGITFSAIEFMFSFPLMLVSYGWLFSSEHVPCYTSCTAVPRSVCWSNWHLGHDYPL